MQSEMYYDRKHDFELEQVGEAAAPAEGGGLGGSLGGDLGGADDMAGLTDEAPPEGEEADPGPLLAAPAAEAGPAPEPVAPEAPAKRDDFGRPMTTTDNSKGKWYTPRSKRGGDRRTGKRQSMNASSGQQSSGKSRRSYLPGMSDLYRLSEENRPNYYDEQEQELFQESRDIKKLIDSLESEREKND